MINENEKGEDMSEEKDEWQIGWEARMAGLESNFSKCDDNVLHGVVPFMLGRQMGGSPDIVTFSSYTKGKLYVTADLLGSDQKPNSHGNYELAVVHQGEEKWGVGIISGLAYYTLENVLDHGHTMDVGPAVPEGSTIAGLLFKRIADFDYLGSPANVLCCIGITKDELAFKFEHSSEELIAKLPENYLLTEMNRESHIRA